MKCADCILWTLLRKTAYDNGDEVITFKAPEGKGRCEQLHIDTDPDFGCTYFLQAKDDSHTVFNRKDGAPHLHWTMGKCPDCQANGSSNDSACHWCAGTGSVRYYDDGFIGDERTRKHPKEDQLPVASDPGTMLNAPVKKEPFTEGSSF